MKVNIKLQSSKKMIIKHIAICIVLFNFIACNTNSFENLLKSAEKGDAEAQYKIAERYYYNEKDCNKAIDWYEKSANQGYVIAQHKLGLCYLEGN